MPMTNRRWTRFVPALLACGIASTCATITSAAGAVRSIADARLLSGATPAATTHVRIRGVVTLRTASGIVIQDDSAGIFADFDVARIRGKWKGNGIPESVEVGVEVELDGTIDSGSFTPLVLPSTVRVFGPADLPQPRRTDPKRFFSGADDCQRVEVEGVVHAADDAGTDWQLALETADRPFSVVVAKSAVTVDPQSLIDAEVRVIGVPLSLFNTRGEFVQPRVMAGLRNWLTVVSAAPHEAFDCPEVAISSLARMRPEAFNGHRIRTQGIVIHTVPGGGVYLQEGAGAVRVALRSVEDVTPGDRVEVAGFLDRSGRIAGLTNAILRTIAVGDPPSPVFVNPAEVVALNAAVASALPLARPGDYEGCLIRFPARLLESRGTDDGGLLLLSAGKTSVMAVVQPSDFARIRELRIGSDVDVTGIVATDWKFPTQWPAVIPDWMTLIVRSADDVRIIRGPSSWTPEQLALLLGGVATVLAWSLAWAWLLRRRVKAQATLLAAEMRSRRDAAVEFEATLKERNRLAANLHDTLLQTLGGIGFQLDACEGRSQNEAESKVHFDVARRMVNHATSQLHTSVWALRSLPIRERTFPEALRALIGRIGEGHAAGIDVQTSDDLDDVPEFVAGNLLLIVQEAVSNALRHGRPRSITVQVGDHPATQSIHVTVRDDGAGFAVGRQQGIEQGHFGLHGMRERAERLGGSLSIDSRPGGGTTVSIKVRRRDYDHDLVEQAPAGSRAPMRMGFSSNGDGPAERGTTA